MKYSKIKSYAKLNLALNIVGKANSLHRIESIVSFINLYDLIKIKQIKSKKHLIKFKGKFSKNINDNNTISKLLEILEKKKILKDKKFKIEVDKYIPNKAGLGGGSMNAASILKFLIKKKIIRIKKKEMVKISNLIGSDVILGLNQKNAILNSKKKIRYFNNIKKFYPLIVKPNFGCSTKKIYSKVRKFNKVMLNRTNKKMFSFDYLKKMNNDLEYVAFLRYPKLKIIKSYLENSLDPVFVRMTGSGSALVAYFQTKKRCELAKKRFNKNYKNYWCIASKTI
jgi:4-diphosphocytidyl-2-C-methyl-D-erythritol kinase